MIRTVEKLALVSFHLSLGWWAYRALSFGPEINPMLHIGVIVLGFFLADWFSGIVHWMCDHLGTPETPLWGLIAGPFRDHHDDPLKITTIPLSENLGYSAIAGCLFFWVTVQFIPVGTGLGWTWLWFLEFSLLSNLFHRWSHFPAARKPAWMKTLQRLGVLLPPAVHGAHHKAPYRVNYCILSGWANPVTNHTPWTLLEKALSRLGVTISD
jgi:ubiquitin-conjugating enzyme E2 variant